MLRGRGANRLAGETSPYLLQHAHNPVDWYPWGAEALSRARREDRPILLSVGYAACHWCHVMERESFENQSIAQRMNDGFVCIKVDREERPDIDDIYMSATVAMQGRGGWPMTVFLTPEQEPFFAGTYFPPETSTASIGFGALVARIAELWQTDRERVLRQANELTSHLGELSQPLSASEVPDQIFPRACEQLAGSFDERFGGFGRAPKFPPCAALSLLLRQHRRTQDEHLLAMVTTTLDGMLRGGLRDHLGGGFARYSTDDRWLVPHFEKMLYDNAQLASIYLEGAQATGSPEYAAVATETLDYVLGEMQAPEGGYYCSTDADSEGEEGRFFVMSPEAVHRALDTRRAQIFCLYYDVTPLGNWEGKSVLNTPRPLSAVARQLALSEREASELLSSAKRQMLAERATRVPPLLDDKVLTSWNGLMLAAMAEGARVLGRPRYFESARRAARFLLSEMERPDGGLYRTWRRGHAHLGGYLEDYAYLADGLISLYESGSAELSPGEPQEYLLAAQSLAERMLRDFAAPDGAFYATAHDHEPLLVRTRNGNDGALPSANAVAARVLWRLGRHLDREDWLLASKRALEAYAPLMERAPHAFATALSVLDAGRESPIELVFAGERDDETLLELMRAASRVYLPHGIRAVAWQGREADTPLTRGKGQAGEPAALYVCRNRVCDRPIMHADAAEDALRRVARATLTERPPRA